MSLLRRLPGWPLILLLAIIVIREWNIRRHEPAIGDWPRIDRQPTR